MKTYLLSFIDRLKRKDKELDAKAILCGRKWSVFNDSGSLEIYKFREDGKVLISINGEGQYYNWSFDAIDNSIEIQDKEKVYSLQTAFVDEYVFALQLQGTNNYAFLIDVNNSDKFSPKTYGELVSYYQAKEQKLLADEQAEEERKQQEKQAEIERQKQIEQEKKLRIQHNKMVEEAYQKVHSIYIDKLHNFKPKGLGQFIGYHYNGWWALLLNILLCLVVYFLIDFVLLLCWNKEGKEFAYWPIHLTVSLCFPLLHVVIFDNALFHGFKEKKWEIQSQLWDESIEQAQSQRKYDNNIIKDVYTRCPD